MATRYRTFDSMAGMTGKIVEAAHKAMVEIESKGGKYVEQPS